MSDLSSRDALATVVTELGGEHREGQVAMVEAVASAIESGEHLLVQAGTGTGKSLAYLVPSILHAVDLDGKPVVIATATLALQRQLVERDLPRVVEALAPHLPRPVSFAVLKGRHNYLCLDRLHRDRGEDDPDGLFDIRPTSDLSRQSLELRAWAEVTESGDRDDYPETVDPRVWRSMAVSGRECLGRQRCSYADDCFAERARAKASEADIIVTNHAILAIDAITGLPLLPDHGVVVIDEGHELVDRATQAATDELSASVFERAARKARPFLDDPERELLADALDALADALEGEESASRGSTLMDPMDRQLLLALTLVRDACHRAIGALAAVGDGEADGRAADRHQARAAVQEVHDVAGRLVSASAGDVAWLDRGERRAPTIRVAPLTVDSLLGSHVFSDIPVVVTSATLTIGGGFEAMASAFGLTEGEWTGLDVGSPFDYERQGILYVPAGLPRPGREGVADEVLEELGDLIDAAGGRTLALFSSWRGVERARDVLTARFAGRPDRPIHVQGRGDAVADLIRRFADDARSSLLGTLTLWQGVDVPGPSCILVAIDRIPFPRPDDPLVAARSRRAEESGRSGFAEVSIPRAAVLLAQGTGRLIRGTADRGVVAVLDSRLETAGYGRMLRSSLPPLWYSTDGTRVREALSRLDAELGSGSEPPQN